MSRRRQSEVIKTRASPAQQPLDGAAAVPKLSVVAPGADDAPARVLPGPCAPLEDGLVVARSNRIGQARKRTRVGAPPREYVADPKSAETELPGSPLAAFDRWIIRDFGCRRWIQHDEYRVWTTWLPDPGQAVSITLAVRVDRDRFGSRLTVPPGNHDPALPKTREG